MTISFDHAKRDKTLIERGLDFADAERVFAGVLSNAKTLVRITVKLASSVSVYSIAGWS